MPSPFPEIVALVPMRHDSERVPGKNYRDFGGAPLYHHIVRALLDCGRVSRVVIDTDSPFIFADAARHFPEVTLLKRPRELLGGEVPMNSILLHDVSQVAGHYYLQTHSTNPLLRPQTIAKAVDAFLAALPGHDSLFSVTARHVRLWDAAGRPLNHDPAVLLRTQDLEPVYEENSNLYLFSAASLRQCGNRIGRRPMLFEIPAWEAMDIDEEFDFRLAESVYRATQAEGARS
ncbi:acylneuraminate cytidylyltransferase family protein [Solidesulfovibrio sp.]|uniref:acylneuraminate cytidylyltransferase family protein n=1 Tax=Solidesulfovibrio sp. TaxID=2910990 RepID=UPI00263726B1|nr:acylneuraminate cytidylyltransferase family protein [Solidesulfovibrio sp.]